MESGHFADGNRVLSASRQRSSEQCLRAQFEGYLSVARRHSQTGRWLDIGCGTGTLLELAELAGYRGEGIELTADRRATASSLTALRIHDRPVEEVNFADGTFEVVTMINVFSHLTNPLATFAELQRILTPGGVLIVVTGEIHEGAKKKHSTSWSLGDHLFFLGNGTMYELASRVGLTVIEHNRRWTPALVLTRERFRLPGRSRLRNAVKRVCLAVPGLFPLIRLLGLRLQADNKTFSSVFVLSPSGARRKEFAVD